MKITVMYNVTGLAIDADERENRGSTGTYIVETV
jgi:hypothetical protein